LRSRLLLAALSGVWFFVAAVGAEAKVYNSRSEALALAFPDADRIESEVFVLDEGQAARVEQIAQSPLESKLVKLHKAIKGDAVLGYAFIDMHTVRTLPEAFLVVLTPDGEVRSLRLLAFHEPTEYQPTNRWYGQFERKSQKSPLRLGDDIHGIVGATLSARATTRGVRRALALYEILVQSGA
jgi:hypothetical protein